MRLHAYSCVCICVAHHKFALFRGAAKTGQQSTCFCHHFARTTQCKLWSIRAVKRDHLFNIHEQSQADKNKPRPFGSCCIIGFFLSGRPVTTSAQWAGLLRQVRTSRDYKATKTQHRSTTQKATKVKRSLAQNRTMLMQFRHPCLLRPKAASQNAIPGRSGPDVSILDISSDAKFSAAKTSLPSSHCAPGIPLRTAAELRRAHFQYTMVFKPGKTRLRYMCT